MIAAGTVVDGRYLIEAELGHGGMASVHRARDRKHDRVVAVKVMRPEIASQLGAERFLQEIRLSAQLAHPHIVPLFDSGEADGLLYFTMPCLEAETLRHRITREGRLEVAEVIRLTREIADALSYAHRRGILHRDVKPENVLLFEGHAAVADFGIARAIASAGGNNLTATGLAVGTAAYMSPEQALGDPGVDARSDVFSLACVVFEMLTGEPPFGRSLADGAVAQRFSGPRPDVRARRPDVPDAVAAAVTRALAADPAERWPDVSDFAAALSNNTLARAEAGVTSIAVLPFANLSQDAEDEIFADGMTEELIADLSRIRSLRVTSRTSVMRLKGERDDLRTIARKLGVRYVLEGSVRRSSSALRITAQLVDASTDTPLWGDKFSGSPEDVFDVQERVSREIVRALELTLTPAEDRQLSARPITDVRVLDCYLRARHEVYQMSGDSLQRAEALLAGGLAMAPGTPQLECWLGLAEVMLAKTDAGYDERVLMRAEERAQRVRAADPDLADGPYLLGTIAHQRGELAEAARQLSRAIELDGNHTDAMRWLALTYFFAGQVEPALALADRVLALDPLAAISWSWRAGMEWATGRFASAAAYSARGVELDPTGMASRWLHGYTLAMHGDLAAAQAECDFLLREHPSSPYTCHLAGLLHGLAGRLAEARAALEPLDRMHMDHHESFHAAESYAALGDLDRALALLETGIARGMYPLEFIRSKNPLFTPLRNHPGFARVLALAERRWSQFREAVGQPASVT